MSKRKQTHKRKQNSSRGTTHKSPVDGGLQATASSNASPVDQAVRETAPTESWKKTKSGDLIISEDPVKGTPHIKARDERRYRKKRIERLRKKYGLEHMTERKDPLPISVGMRIWTIVETLALSAVWLFSFNQFYDRLGDILVGVGLAVLYFGILFAMHVSRGFLESRRRYDIKPSASSIHYYMQMVHYDVRWWGLITFGIYAAMWVVERILPISGNAMDVIYIASAAYLGYIWTIKYKGIEFVPFTYMETIFCLIAMFSNYIVFFLIR